MFAKVLTFRTPWASLYLLGFKDCDNWRAQSGHAGSMNVALADGSVRRVSTSISQRTWTSVLLPRDGSVPGTDW